MRVGGAQCKEWARLAISSSAEELRALTANDREPIGKERISLCPSIGQDFNAVRAAPA